MGFSNLLVITLLLISTFLILNVHGRWVIYFQSDCNFLTAEFKFSNIFDLRCFKSGSEVQDTNECTHGAEKNICNKLQCLSGLGERCGENKFSQLLSGKCANSLMCCSGFCTGCMHGICDERMCRLVSIEIPKKFNSTK
jgi:hypothetical protein